MRGARARWLGVLLVACVFAPVDTAGAGSPGRRATVAGTTVVRSARSASIAVRLPKPVQMDVYDDFHLDSPRGRLTAVVLKKEGGWTAPFAKAVHTGFCATRGCLSAYPRAGIAYIWAPGSTDGLRGTLPAGNYRIYVVTDGAPVAATIRFRGLSGSTRLTPVTPARASVVSPAPTVAEPAGSPSLFAGGSVHHAGRLGALNATAVWKELPVYGEHSAVGLCLYDAAPPKGGTTPPYQMPCTNGRGGMPPYVASTFVGDQVTTPVGPGRFLSGIHGGFLLPPDDDVALGGYHNTAGPVTAAYVHQLWLDF